ncbi:NUDIX hydrolase [Treponema phagedenis]|uniref:NUDIX hydrolase n=1 Tax=Treponema phagedenis TaxID=162 RepID=UPI001981453B|nr:NUDIX hydrolase [Treponema phagedenis]QSH94246.1 DNA mismatch repair protein MutT [Treponema phagedenis]
MKNIHDLCWAPQGSKEICETRVFTVKEIESLSPKNEKKTFVSIFAPEWVIVIPRIVDSTGTAYFLMVTQWRHGSAALSTEFPGGVVDKGETPEQAGLRELLEETGKEAVHIEPLGILYPNPAIMQNRSHVFLADCGEKTVAKHLDLDEFLESEAFPVHEILKKLGQPPFDHALMCSAMFLYLQKYGKLS